MTDVAVKNNICQLLLLFLTYYFDKVLMLPGPGLRWHKDLKLRVVTKHKAEIWQTCAFLHSDVNS